MRILVIGGTGFSEVVAETDATARTIEWERGYPPPPLAAQFDSAAEDAALAALAARALEGALRP